MTNRRTFMAGLGGAGVALAGAAAFDAARYLQHAAPASTRAAATTMGQGSIDPSWVISGTPRFEVADISKSHDGRSATGLWTCIGPAVFRWQYRWDETAHVIEGLVHVEYQGERFTLAPGDNATFLGGTDAVWTVPDRVKKVWTLQHPGTLVHTWRKILRAMR